MQNPTQLRCARRPAVRSVQPTSPKRPARVRTPADSTPPSARGVTHQTKPLFVRPSHGEEGEPNTSGLFTTRSSTAALGYPPAPPLTTASSDPQRVIRTYFVDHAPTRLTTRAPPPLARNQVQGPATAAPPRERTEWVEQLPPHANSNPGSRYHPYPIPGPEYEYEEEYAYVSYRMDPHDRERIQDWALKVQAGSKRDLYSGGYEHEENGYGGEEDEYGDFGDSGSGDGDDESAGNSGGGGTRRSAAVKGLGTEAKVKREPVQKTQKKRGAGIGGRFPVNVPTHSDPAIPRTDVTYAIPYYRRNY